MRLPIARALAKDAIISCPPVIDIDRWTIVDEESVPVEVHSGTILYVGRLAPHKGVRQLIDGFSLLAARDQRVRLVCVGGTPIRPTLPP